jgi:hypothetical protein
MLSKLRTLGEATILIPLKAKSQELFNEMPLDLSRLLIKRRSKDSPDFIIHYHLIENMEDVASKQIMELYSQLRPSKHQLYVRKTSMPAGMGLVVNTNKRRLSKGNAYMMGRRGTYVE